MKEVVTHDHKWTQAPVAGSTYTSQQPKAGFPRIIAIE